MTTQPNRRPASHNAERIITQAELERLEALKAAHDAYEEARGSVRERVLRGVPVEQGHFVIEVTSCEHRSLTHDVVRTMLGPVAEFLIDNIPPTVRHHMSIHVADHAHHRGAPRPAFDPAGGMESDQSNECRQHILEQLVAMISHQLAAMRQNRQPRAALALDFRRRWSCV